MNTLQKGPKTRFAFLKPGALIETKDGIRAVKVAAVKVGNEYTEEYAIRLTDGKRVDQLAAYTEVREIYLDDPIKVGDGATYHSGTDRYPYTVIAVKGNRIWVQADNEIHIKGTFQTGDAEFEYERNPKGAISVWSRRKDGHFRRVGGDGTFVMTVGSRDYYQDPHF